MKLLTSSEMRALEQRAVEAGVSIDELMRNAGLAVAQEVWMTLGTLEDRRILLLAGPGNNGGDTLIAARHLVEWAAQVAVYLLVPRAEDDPLIAPLAELNVPIVAAGEDPGYETLDQFLSVAEVIVDGLLGTGANRPVEGELAEILSRVRAAMDRTLRPKVIAVDLPTGVNADTGHADPLAVASEVTVALGEAKAGLYLGQGSALAGRVQVVDIGIPSSIERPAGIDLLDRTWAKRRLPARPADANKGTFGKVLAVAGSRNFAGAAALAGTAAYRAGAGLVTLALPKSVYKLLAGRVLETTYLPLPAKHGVLAKDAAAEVLAAVERYDVLLMGCGLGAEARAAVLGILGGLGNQPPRALVLDADALNALAGEDEWWKGLPAATVLTPHPGEMSRLAGLDVAAIQNGRLDIARRHAAKWGVTVVLKGANTVIAAADGRTWLAPFANPAMATAGTGDVLAGVIAALLGQGLDPAEAAAVGVYLHGMAGDAARAELGPAGMLASDLLGELPKAIKSLVEPTPIGMPGMFGGGGGGGMGMGGNAMGGLGAMAGLGGGGGAGGLGGLGGLAGLAGLGGGQPGLG